MTVVQSMPAVCHERAQLAIDRIRDPNLALIHKSLKSAAALIYSQTIQGNIPPRDSYTALINIEHAAKALCGEIVEPVTSLKPQAG